MQIDEQLRDTIAKSGFTLSEIAEGSGVSTGVLSRFVAEERDIRLATAAKLAEYLGLTLAPLKKRK